MTFIIIVESTTTTTMFDDGGDGPTRISGFTLTKVTLSYNRQILKSKVERGRGGEAEDAENEGDHDDRVRGAAAFASGVAALSLMIILACFDVAQSHLQLPAEQIQ